MNGFRKLGFIEYNGRIRVHKAATNVMLHDDLPYQNSASPVPADFPSKKQPGGSKHARQHPA
jgi:CRP/FNR family transcriptional regulator, cyclic AMP receptor protein